MKLPELVNVLLLGSGGREHAIAKKLAESNRLARLFIAPGNGGTQECGTNVSDVSPMNFGVIKQVVLSNNINLVIVGPEEPLVRGITDFFLNDPEIHHVPVIGPSLEGAKLEGSKSFAKGFMSRHQIPTAAYQTFTKDTISAGHAFLETLHAPYVLKADGLAAGKGVLILDDLEQAKSELGQLLEGKFGQASQSVVIEAYLSGIELSVFVATDGISYKILPEAKDYKRIGEGDTGLNTGGMGAVSPVPFADAAFLKKVKERIVEPTIQGLRAEKINYKGFLFIGLMNVGGDPFVIEYNVRMGDPESEVVFPRIESDLIELFEGMACGNLDQKEILISPKIATTVVCVSGGYPEAFVKDFEITGLDQVTESFVYQSGTTFKAGKVRTSGGRVLAVTSLGNSLAESLQKSFASIAKISYTNLYFRKDIGKDLSE